jgi:hypothetical protein
MKWMMPVVLAACLCGCGERGAREPQGTTPLVFEEIPDTSGLSKGEPLLSHIEPYRMPNGALRFRGTLDFPDGTRFQVTILDQSRNAILQRLQLTVRDRRFDSPPILGERGPLPKGRYRLEYLAHFNDAWQPAHVLEATDHGRRLRGPGVTMTRQGPAAFFLVEERTL